MNIRIANAFRTTSSEALCILAGLTRILIKTEKAVRPYNKKRRQKQIINREVELTKLISTGRRG